MRRKGGTNLKQFDTFPTREITYENSSYAHHPLNGVTHTLLYDASRRFVAIEKDDLKYLADILSFEKTHIKNAGEQLSRIILQRYLPYAIAKTYHSYLPPDVLEPVAAIRHFPVWGTKSNNTTYDTQLVSHALRAIYQNRANYSSYIIPREDGDEILAKTPGPPNVRFDYRLYISYYKNGMVAVTLDVDLDFLEIGAVLVHEEDHGPEFGFEPFYAPSVFVFSEEHLYAPVL